MEFVEKIGYDIIRTETNQLLVTVLIFYFFEGGE